MDRGLVVQVLVDRENENRKVGNFKTGTLPWL